MEISEILGQDRDTKLYRIDESLVSNTDGVGVEVELENIVFFRNGNYNITPYINSLPVPTTFWNFVEDGSLREGTEFIFKGPMVGANITSALDEMDTFLKVYRRNGKPVKVTDRCSVHVHLDVRDLNESQLNNLILIYLSVERVIFQYINPLRLKNNYCRPLSDSSFKYTLNDMLSQAKDKNLSSLCHVVKRDCDKYSALNVLPITKFGSIEFRHHHGTTNVSDIKDWINIILSLKVISRSLSIDNILDLYNNIGPLELLSTVFANTKIIDFINKDEDQLKVLMSKGICDVKEILDMNDLSHLTRTRSRSRVKEENTLIHQFKLVHGLCEPVGISTLAMGS